MKNIAIQFGQLLDKDDFEAVKKLLSEDCIYAIGKDTLIGPDNICNSYEQNMLEGRKKLDKLEWGKSRIETISDNTFYVHFTDYLTHKNQAYTHRCKQQLTIDERNLITNIKHINDQEEQNRLDAYYKSVGLK